MFYFSLANTVGLFSIFSAIVLLLQWVFSGRKRKYRKYLNIFTEQLLGMLKANLPLGLSIRALSYPGMKRGVRKIHTKIEKDITSGKPLSEALARHPRVFPEWYISLIRAGEESGNLESAFEQILRHHESMTNFSKNLAYPVGYFVLLNLYVVLVGMFLNTFIVPKFQAMFKEAGVSSYYEIGWQLYSILYVLVLSLGLILILVCGFPFFRFVTKRIKGARLLIDWLSLRLPIIGGIFKKVALVRFSRTLGVLFQAGVPVLKALDIIRNLETNRFLQRLYEGLAKRTKEGEDLSSQLGKAKIFPYTFLWMVSVGEQSGRLDKALIDAGEFYMLEIDLFLNRVVNLALPVCVILAGIFVGIIVVNMFSFIVRIIEVML